MQEKESKEEFLKFLKREDIKTMAKDIARLRESEAKKEGERIAQIQPKMLPKIEKPVEKFKSNEQEKLTELKQEDKEGVRRIIQQRVSALPSSPSKFKKVLVRIPVLIVLILIIGNLFLFWYWYLKVEKKQTPEPEITEQKIPIVVIPPEPEIPTSSIIENETITLEISNLAEVPEAISKLVKTNFPKDQFIRILIKNTEENKYLGVKEFFESFEIQAPESFYEKLDNNITLFVYSHYSKEENNLGFAVKIIKEQDLFNIIKNWEVSLEQDTKNLYDILGKAGSPSNPNFKKATYNNTTFRYLSFPPEGLGIVWAITKNTFLFTSSGESMFKAIDKIIPSI